MASMVSFHIKQRRVRWGRKGEMNLFFGIQLDLRVWMFRFHCASFKVVLFFFHVFFKVFIMEFLGENDPI